MLSSPVTSTPTPTPRAFASGPVGSPWTASASATAMPGHASIPASPPRRSAPRRIHWSPIPTGRFSRSTTCSCAAAGTVDRRSRSGTAGESSTTCRQATTTGCSRRWAAHDDGVRARRRRAARRPRGGDAARAARTRGGAGHGGRHLRRRDQRCGDRDVAQRRDGAAPGRDVASDREERRVRGLALRALGDPRADRHPPAREQRVAGDADRGVGDRADRGPSRPVRVRGREHRGGRGALVLLGPDRRGGDGLGGRAGAAPARRDRRRALPRRRDRQLDPRRPCAVAGGDADLRHARRPRRPAPGAASLALGGRARCLRDRPAPPVHRRPGGDPGQRRGPRHAHRPARAAALQRPLGPALSRLVGCGRGDRARVRRLAGLSRRARGELMRVPPLVVRRVTVTPLVLALELALLAASPLLTALAALLSPLFGGRRPLRALALALAYAYAHVTAVAACALLWASGRASDQGPHYAVLRWFVGVIAGTALRVARVKITVRDSGSAEAALAAHERPLVVLSIHSGEGDSLLVLDHLLRRHRRRPRIVMHQALALDPLIDLIGRRLPNRFIDPRGGDIEVEIAEMSRRLGAEDAVVIFPEGGNFSPARRRRAIERLLRRGHRRAARRAEAMRHLAAPRPGGALAALEGAPDADVVFVAHHGFPESMAQAWRELPHRTEVEVELWLVPAAQIPADEQERIDWLFSWWADLDAWVAARRESL